MANFDENDIMAHRISIDYPESLALSLKMGNKQFVSEMKILSLVKLYELGKVSSGYAADLLKLNRIDFLDLLKKYNASYFHKGLEDELEDDMNNA